MAMIKTLMKMREKERILHLIISSFLLACTFFHSFCLARGNENGWRYGWRMMSDFLHYANLQSACFWWDGMCCVFVRYKCNLWCLNASHFELNSWCAHARKKDRGAERRKTFRSNEMENHHPQHNLPERRIHLSSSSHFIHFSSARSGEKKTKLIMSFHGFFLRAHRIVSLA